MKATRRSSSRAAAARPSTATPTKARSSAPATLTGVVDYQPKELVLTARAGTPLAEIEALLAEQNQMLAFEPPHFGRTPATPRRLHRRRPVRPAPPLCRRGARLRARRAHDRRHRPAAALRRPGDQERRRLRRVAPDGRRARHARPDHRSLAQGAAKTRGGNHAAIRTRRSRRDRENEPVGGAAAAAVGDLLARRPADGAAVGRGLRGAGRAGQARRRDAEGRRRLLAAPARPGHALLRQALRCGGWR